MHTWTPGTFRLSAMRATPYPNRLLEFSVTLPETQLRVLNLLIRLTLGWHAGTGHERRSTTTITIAQLTKRVKRTAAASVAEALAALIQSGVIEIYVTDGGSLEIADLVKNRRRNLTICLVRSWVEEQ